MVLVLRQQAMSMRRQSSCPGTLGKPQQAGVQNGGGSFVSCAMGDDDNVSSVSSVSTHQSSFSSLTSSERRSSLLPSTLGRNATTSTSKSFYYQQQHQQHHVKTPRWILGLLCMLTACSWTRAVQYRNTSFGFLSDIELEFESFVSQKKQSSKLLEETTDTMNSFAKQKWKLKRTQRLFLHETRMLEEMAEMEVSSASDNAEIPKAALEKFKQRRSGDVAKKWIEHRQEAILHKIYNLQAYIQEESRKRVIEKYGYGPHQVVFEVKTREARKPGRFTVRMAPLSTVPHSIETFLDLVTAKIWDNTILYSHHSQAHVVAAAPINYGTFDSKEDNMKALGFTGVSFPEYSEDYPHKKYTIGFSNMSPNFFINALNNENHHGPGGQQHHELEGDADPCFGEIIEGFGVLQDMQYNRHRGEEPKGWQDYDLTRITTARLMPWP